MKTMIPAVAGTFLLVPLYVEPDEADAAMGAEPFVEIEAVPVLGWMNFATNANDIPGTRTGATPVVPYWPEGVSQAAGYQIPDDQGGMRVCVPFAKRTMRRAQYDEFAKSVTLGIEEARDQEDSISGDMAQREPADLQTERREDRDEGDHKMIALPNGTFSVTAVEDAREYGKTAVEGGQRRTKEEIKADEAYLAAIESTGKTIRAANTRWKTHGSRVAVLADLAGIELGGPGEEREAPGMTEAEHMENVDASFGADGDDEDLIG